MAHFYRSIFIILIALLALIVGCDLNPARIEFEEITIENATGERLFVRTDHGGVDLEPGEEGQVRYIRWRSEVYSGERYDDDTQVKLNFFDELGCTAVAIVATNRQLSDEYGHRFLIQPEHLTPLEQRLDCNLTRLPGGANLPHPSVDGVQ